MTGLRAALVAAVAVTSSSVASMASAAPAEEGVAAFRTVVRVLQSPRCMNCHPDGDRPLQYDESQPHAMDVGRQASALGQDCSSCHQTENLPGEHMPPGAPNWHLPPEKTPMVFEGRSATELCNQLKDPAQTGGKDLKAELEHISHDKLVLWGWSPGEGRTTPPVSHEEFVRAFSAWIDAGAPCP